MLCRSFTHFSPTDTSQSLACISSLLVSPDYSNDCKNQCTPPHKQVYQKTQRTLTYKHNQTCLYIPPAVMNDILRQWIRAPPLDLISHCHKSIRERGMFDVVIYSHLFGATGLAFSREEVSER